MRLPQVSILWINDEHAISRTVHKKIFIKHTWFFFSLLQKVRCIFHQSFLAMRPKFRRAGPPVSWPNSRWEQGNGREAAADVRGWAEGSIPACHQQVSCSTDTGKHFCFGLKDFNIYIYLRAIPSTQPWTLLEIDVTQVVTKNCSQ